VGTRFDKNHVMAIVSPLKLEPSQCQELREKLLEGINTVLRSYGAATQLELNQVSVTPGDGEDPKVWLTLEKNDAETYGSASSGAVFRVFKYAGVTIKLENIHVCLVEIPDTTE
jgi:hypothetical protein